MLRDEAMMTRIIVEEFNKQKLETKLLEEVRIWRTKQKHNL